MIWKYIILVACIYLVYRLLAAWLQRLEARLDRDLERLDWERDERHAAMRAECEARHEAFMIVARAENQAQHRAWLAARGLEDQPR